MGWQLFSGPLTENNRLSIDFIFLSRLLLKTRKTQKTQKRIIQEKIYIKLKYFKLKRITVKPFMLAANKVHAFQN
jgi:hypothetical protein